MKMIDKNGNNENQSPSLPPLLLSKLVDIGFLSRTKIKDVFSKKSSHNQGLGREKNTPHINEQDLIYTSLTPKEFTSFLATNPLNTEQKTSIEKTLEIRRHVEKTIGEILLRKNPSNENPTSIKSFFIQKQKKSIQKLLTKRGEEWLTDDDKTFFETVLSMHTQEKNPYTVITERLRTNAKKYTYNTFLHAYLQQKIFLNDHPIDQANKKHTRSASKTLFSKRIFSQVCPEILPENLDPIHNLRTVFFHRIILQNHLLEDTTVSPITLSAKTKAEMCGYTFLNHLQRYLTTQNVSNAGEFFSYVTKNIKDVPNTDLSAFEQVYTHGVINLLSNELQKLTSYLEAAPENTYNKQYILNLSIFLLDIFNQITKTIKEQEQGGSISQDDMIAFLTGNTKPPQNNETQQDNETHLIVFQKKLFAIIQLLQEFLSQYINKGTSSDFLNLLYMMIQKLKLQRDQQGRSPESIHTQEKLFLSLKEFLSLFKVFGGQKTTISFPIEQFHADRLPDFIESTISDISKHISIYPIIKDSESIPEINFQKNGLLQKITLLIKRSSSVRGKILLPVLSPEKGINRIEMFQVFGTHISLIVSLMYISLSDTLSSIRRDKKDTKKKLKAFISLREQIIFLGNKIHFKNENNETVRLLSFFELDTIRNEYKQLLIDPVIKDFFTKKSTTTDKNDEYDEWAQELIYWVNISIDPSIEELPNYLSPELQLFYQTIRKI